nr:serine/threonine protein kinase [Chloroflexota bacterium]
MGLKAGDVLAGKFKVVTEIGEGGFGKIYLGYDEGMDRYVAIKELLHESAEVSPEDYEDYKRRFRKEAQVVSKFSHPNVVTAYSLESDDEGDLYLILEYVDGGSLKSLLAQGPLEPARAVAIALDLCEAIDAIWKWDIVHRDIKPSNILLTKEGQAKLTDFGVAQVGHETRRTQEARAHPGTPAYKSPEQASSTGYLDQRSDLYALGLVLYEMLTGKLYLRNRVPPHRLNRKVSRALSAVVMKALQENPADRYQSAQEMRAALQEAIKGGQFANIRSALGTLREIPVRGVAFAMALLALAAAIYLGTRTYDGSRGVTVGLTATAETRRETLRAQLLATPTFTMSPTPVFTDAFEPDDVNPKAIALGETQRHNFYPDGDADRVSFRVKAGRVYGVITSDLAIGVDTVVVVSVAGQRYENDDAQAGSLGSEVYFKALAEAVAVATISNKGVYNPDASYDLTVIELPPTPLPTPTGTQSPSVTPTSTPTPTGTPTTTPTPTPTETRTPTPTSTQTLTPTYTPTPTITRTPIPTETKTPVPTETTAPTRTYTPTATYTPTETSTPTETHTPVPPTPTHTVTPEPTATLEPTPTETSAMSIYLNGNYG